MTVQHIRVSVATAIIVLATSSCASAQSSTDPDRVRTFSRVLDSLVSSGVPGIQAHVAVGAFFWTGGAGYASIERREPMTTRHRLRLASVTKMMTYAATMELAARGRFSLSDRVVELLPPGTLRDVPHADSITVEQLLDHTSGLHNYNGENGSDFFAALFGDRSRGTRLWTPQELLAFARAPRHSPTGRPGERRSYSSTGYSVLEIVLAHRERKPFAEVLRELVFEPFGLQGACVEGSDCASDSIADSYARPSASDSAGPSPFGGRSAVRGDGLMNLSAGLAHYGAWAGAGGAVAASVEDLAAFMRAVREGRAVVLRDQSRELTAARAKPNVFLSWNGGSWGIQSSIIYEPGRDITIIVLTNATNVGSGSHQIARRLLDEARR